MTIRTQTLLIVASLLAAAVLATAGLLGWSSRQALLAETEAQGLVVARLLARSAAFGARVMTDVEGAIGEQMVVEATMAAHFVALGESAGVGPQEINRRLRQIADDTVLDEIWITDEQGHAYLRNIPEIDFTFSPDPRKQPQAAVFWPLLTGEDKTVVQEACQRDVDAQVFKYAGVQGSRQAAHRPGRLQRRLPPSAAAAHGTGAPGPAAGFRRKRHRDPRARRATWPPWPMPRAFGPDKLPEPAQVDLSRLRKLVSQGRTESHLEDSLLELAAPIGEEGGELKGGVILVTLPTDRMQAAIRGGTLLAMAVSGIVLLLGSAIAILGASRISRPIADLTEMTRRIASGDLSQAIDIRSRNEIGALAASFNEMTRRLNESIEHLKETTAAKKRIESELEIAHEIQMSMVPKVFPPFPDRSEFDVFAALVPAREVGGDLYDFFFIDDDHLCFVVADVSGKGVPAALFMAATKAFFKAIAASCGSPAEILGRLNPELCRDNESCMFVTLFCGILNVRTGQVDYSNAGHNLPYHLHQGGVRPLENIGGRALGVVEESQYACGRIVLGPGDALLLYSDGVTEAMDESQAFYSDDRLEGFLSSHLGCDPRQIAGNLVADVKAFAGEAPQSDDITVLALRYFGTADEMTEVLEIKLGNKLSELAKFSRSLSEFSGRLGLNPKVTQELELACEEILANIVSYAYLDDREHEIKVRLSAQAGELRVEVEDDGHPFNPLEAPDPDLTTDLEDRKIGGLGIHFVRKLMDGLEYQRQGDRNLLTLRKRTKQS